MKILVTGSAGFIGMHVCKQLLKNHKIIGIDVLNSYYDINLKKLRLKKLKKNKNFKFYKVNINNYNKLRLIFKKVKPQIVIHLAAEVGVRYSLEKPKNYLNSNIIGFFNIIENCRLTKVNKLFYASSSSIYGKNKKKFKENLITDNPLSIYAASKKAGELLAEVYCNLYNISAIGLRFFTVYGPYGRPDMAIFKFTESIFRKKPITIYDKGNLQRDFTYVDDVVNHINNLIYKNFDKHEIFNIGNTKPVKVIKLVSLLEKAIGIKAKKIFTKSPNTEVYKTSADDLKIRKFSHLKKRTPLDKGIKNFISWYKNYRKINF